MALRNAFDGIATESGLRRIANLLTFARDNQDRVRVIVDNAQQTLLYNRNSGSALQGGTSETYYGASSWNTVDAREPLKQQMRLNYTQVRNTRWTF